MVIRFVKTLSVLGLVFLSTKSWSQLENSTLTIPRLWLHQQIEQNLNNNTQNFLLSPKQGEVLNVFGIPFHYQELEIARDEQTRFLVKSDKSQILEVGMIQPGFNFLMKGIRFSGVFEKQIGSQTFRVRVELSCESLALRAWASEARVRGQYVWNSTLRTFELKSKPDLFLSEDRKITIFAGQNCQGAKGFEVWLEQELGRLWAKDPWIWRQLQIELLQRTNLTLTTFNQWPFQYLLNTDEGWTLSNELSLSPKKLPQRDRPILSVPTTTVIERMNIEVKKNQLNQFSLNSLPEFQKLLRSRFLQFFIWPDLLNYSRKSPFIANSHLKSSQYKKVNSSYQMNLSVDVSVQARREQNWIEYLSGSLILSSTIQPRIESQTLKVRAESTQLKMSQPITFSRDYLMKYPNTGWFSSHLITSAIQSTFRNQEFSIPIPAWTMSPEQQFNATSIIESHDPDWTHISIDQIGKTREEP